MSRKKCATPLSLGRLYDLRNLLSDYSRGEVVLGPLDLRDLNEIVVLAIQARERMQDAIADAIEPVPEPPASPTSPTAGSGR